MYWAANQVLIFLTTDVEYLNHSEEEMIRLAVQTSRQTSDNTSDCHIQM